MSNKKQNEELQSRREFFKKAAKAALPVVGAVVLSSIPNVMHAATDCDYNCSGSCSRGCKGSCEEYCKDDCKNTCQWSCSGQCYNSCKGGASPDHGWR